MVSFEAEINALDFAEIDAALSRARAAIRQAQELSLTGLNPAALLGDLGAAMSAVGDVKLDAATVNQLGGRAVEALGTLIEPPALAEIEQIVGGLDRLTERLSVLATVFSGGGDGKQVLDRVFAALSGSLDLDSLLSEITDRAARAFEITIGDEYSGLLRSLTALATNPQPGQLLEILGSVFTGLDIAAAGELVSAAEAVLGMVSGAGDADPLQTAVDAVALRLAAGYQLMDAPNVDVTALQKAIDDIGEAVDLVGSELPRFVSGLKADLRTAATTLADLDLAASLDEMLGELPLPGEDIPRQLVESLEGMADFLEQVTGNAVTTTIAAMKDELLATAGLDQLADLLSILDRVFDEADELLDQLPVRQLRDDAVAALVTAQQKVLSFDGLNFLDDAVTPIRLLDNTIRDLDTTAVTGAVDAVKQQLEGLLAAVDVSPVREAVDAVVEPLGEIVDRLVPFVQGVAAELGQLIDELTSIDFDAAGAATLDLLSGIRAQVAEAVGGSDVPEPVKAAVAAAAAVLRQMDLAAKITVPFDNSIALIDVSALLEPIEGTWRVAGDALAKTTPAALIAELDPPFEELLEALDRVGLQQILDAAQRMFDDLVAELRQLDPRALLAPLEIRFQKLISELTEALDPAPLFAPLRAAYQSLHSLLDEIDVTQTLHSILTGLADMPHQMTTRLADRLQTGLSGTTPAPAPADGFLLGDVLRPLALFLDEVRGRLSDFGATVTGPALAELAAASRGLRALTDPDHGFAVRLGDALEKRLGWLDPNAGRGPLAQLRTDLESFQMAVQTIDVDAGARAQLNTAAANVQFDARIHAQVDADVAGPAEILRSTADSNALGRSLRMLTRALDAALPAELLTTGLDPTTATDAFLDAVFARIDPSDLANELDAIGARIETRFVALAEEFANGLFLLVDAVFTSIQPLMPDSIIARLQDGIDRVLEHFTAFDPGPLEEEVRALINAAVSLLAVHSPAALAAELAAVFDSCIDRIRAQSPAALFADADPFTPIKAQLETMKPSVVLAPLATKTANFSVALDTIANIDLNFAITAVEELKQAFAAVRDGVEREWNALLDELSRISAGASVNINVG
ncbi:hypothetical protein CQY20_09170 [Mycolicibacterium agri]|uniref:Uncharacterized protein n=1 Tax=Mycolicibacterium agri TaxID=36811 RepID=A0A2A7N7G7_MYCAG|nr:hypothetical protein [Mycolicibacterium agri]PEG39713.1 hypothetical protein CQY20_09170 [Mycolicibacterium agri]GFG52580.1 hypothetical protein MAGR_40210 [Mycolicibacterium agri]